MYEEKIKLLIKFLGQDPEDPIYAPLIPAILHSLKRPKASLSKWSKDQGLKSYYCAEAQVQLWFFSPPAACKAVFDPDAKTATLNRPSRDQMIQKMADYIRQNKI